MGGPAPRGSSSGAWRDFARSRPDSNPSLRARHSAVTLHSFSDNRFTLSCEFLDELLCRDNMRHFSLKTKSPLTENRMSSFVEIRILR